MTEPLEVIRTQRTAPYRLTPVRFARAVTDMATFRQKIDSRNDLYKPDLDDLGFIPDGNTSPAHGPVVGLMSSVIYVARPAPTIRMRVIRDRIAPDAPLFPTIDDPLIARILSPKEGIAINTADIPARNGEIAREANCIDLQAVINSSITQHTIVKLHFGSPDGVVVAELGIRVYQSRTVRVKPHLVEVVQKGQATGRSSLTWDLPRILRLFDQVDAVYAQAGVRFVLVPDIDTDGSQTPRAEKVTNYHRSGTVNIDDDQLGIPARQDEYYQVLRQHPEPEMLNVYFVESFSERTIARPSDIIGVAVSRNHTRGANPGGQAGLVVCDEGDDINAAATIAHEIGHSFTLEHYNNQDSDNPSNDIRAHRCLMYPTAGLSTVQPSSPARAKVGYGKNGSGDIINGDLLTTKKFKNIFQSNQIDLLRKAIETGQYKP